MEKHLLITTYSNEIERKLKQKQKRWKLTDGLLGSPTLCPQVLSKLTKRSRTVDWLKKIEMIKKYSLTKSLLLSFLLILISVRNNLYVTAFLFNSCLNKEKSLGKPKYSYQ